jgi:hypothetical protein
VDAFEPRIRELLRPFPRMPAAANRGSGSASRSDSLIESEEERGDLAVADLDCGDH